MKVSVVIPTLNEAAHVGRAITSALSAGASQVIVADGGSTDDTVRQARRLNCQVVQCPRGRGRQQNLGAAQAQGDVLLFLHADNHLHADAVQQVRTALGNTRIQGGAFRQVIDAAGPVYRLLEWGNAWRVRRWGLPYGDQAIFLRREFFEQLGRFPDVTIMEDYILMKRFRRSAWPVLLAGPVYISARRWKRRGVVRQTLHNWYLVSLYRLGVDPDRLATKYRRHDEDGAGG